MVKKEVCFCGLLLRPPPLLLGQTSSVLCCFVPPCRVHVSAGPLLDPCQACLLVLCWWDDSTTTRLTHLPGRKQLEPGNRLWHRFSQDQKLVH